MNYFQTLEQDFKTNYTLYVPLSIILQSCVGSVSAMYILQSSTATYFPFLPLLICVSITMWFNATILAQFKSNFVFKMLLLSLITNVVLAIISL